MLQKRTQLNQRHVGRLHTILNPVFEEATARLNAAPKEFVRIFELETRETVNIYFKKFNFRYFQR